MPTLTTRRKLARPCFIWLLLGGLLLAACQPADLPPSLTLNSSPPPTAAAPTVTVTTAVTLPPPPGLTAVPTAEADPTPLSTRSDEIILAVPPEWAGAGQAAVSQIASSGDERLWQLQVVEQPAAALAQGEASMALVRDEAGHPVTAEPLAFVVPFATEQEAISLEDARVIMTDGHPTITMRRWPQLFPEERALAVDGRYPWDPGYPVQEVWSLQANAGWESAAAQMAAVLRREMTAEAPIRLTAVGDIMLARGLGFMLAQGDIPYPFAGLADVLARGDLTVGNLESALGDAGQPEAKAYPFLAPVEAAESLSVTGFDVMSLANNHAMDYGSEALLQGIRLLQQQGVTAVGAGGDEEAAHTARLLSANGVTVAFLAYVHVPVEADSGFDAADWTATADSPGLAWGDPAAITADVVAARTQADVVVVLLHSGHEYEEAPSRPQVAAAHAAIDAGADLVLGHHAHILQGIEFYHGGVIAYGLGNFAFNIAGPPESMILEVWLDRQGVRQLSLIPVIVQETGQPRLADSAEAQSIRQKVYFLTRLLNNP